MNAAPTSTVRPSLVRTPIAVIVIAAAATVAVIPTPAKWTMPDSITVSPP